AARQRVRSRGFRRPLLPASRAIALQVRYLEAELERQYRSARNLRARVPHLVRVQPTISIGATSWESSRSCTSIGSCSVGVPILPLKLIDRRTLRLFSWPYSSSSP